MSSYNIAAIKAQMGSTSYFQTVMRADELAATVKAAMDFPEFETFMAHEKMQREINESRVEQEIVPYLTNSPDRFFGSIIVLAYKPHVFEFESVKDISGAKFKTKAYEGKENQLGVLTIEGGKLFALDGQHRLHALRTIINYEKTPHLNRPITGPFRKLVANDQLSVIFLQFESVEKARRIFNKVNRYAKPTSNSTNILTSEDDGYAIITRALISDDDPDKFGGSLTPPLRLHYQSTNKKLIEMEKLSLSNNDESLTTLSVIYNSVKKICASTGHPNLEEKQVIVRPTDDILAVAYDDCATWWTAIMEIFIPFSPDRLNPEHIISGRHYERTKSLAYRPKGQEVLIDGLMMAHEKSKLKPSTLINRLNLVPMKLGSKPWLGMLVGSNGKMITKNANTAKLLVAYYLIGDRIGAKDLRALEDGWRNIHGRDNLPRPIESN
jgi:DNA sulfur modification protein DndB